MINPKTVTWQVETLTPLHIGDGEELQENFDFTRVRDGLQVIDIEKLLDSLADNQYAMGEIGRSGFNLNTFVRQYKIDLPVLYTLSCQGRPSSVRRFLKDGYGRPYLAGSSFKGALRTALWTSLDRRNLPSPSLKRDFNDAVKKLDGRDAHSKITRALQVSDSVSLASGETLTVSDIRFFNLGHSNKPLWKDFSSRQNKGRFQDTSGIFVETVKPGVTFYLRAAIDPFLVNEDVRKKAGIPACKGMNSLTDLCKTVNRHSLEIAEREQGFFSQYGQNKTARFYQQLIGTIKETDASQDACIVRLAWSSGWIGITGGWLQDDELMQVREKTTLGKKGHPVFPKTRRLAMADGTPCLPLGWVKVSVTDTAVFYRAGTAVEDVGEQAETSSPEPVEETPVDPEKIRRDKREQFTASLPNPQDFPAQSTSFIKRVRDQDDEDLRRELCKLLLDLASKLPKKKKLAKAIKNGKQWAVALQNLCIENGLEI